MYASWEISHGVACLSARELDIYSRGNRLPFRLWSNEIGGVLERIQRQFRRARYSSMEISTFPWIKGFEIFPYVRMYDRAKDNKDCKDCEHFKINKIISI